MKSGNFNFLEPSGPLQACNGTALPFYFSQLSNRNSHFSQQSSPIVRLVSVWKYVLGTPNILLLRWIRPGIKHALLMSHVRFCFTVLFFATGSFVSEICRGIFVTCFQIITQVSSLNSLPVRMEFNLNVILPTMCRSASAVKYVIIIIIIIINCNWVVTRWQRLFYMYTKYEIDY